MKVRGEQRQPIESALGEHESGTARLEEAVTANRAVREQCPEGTFWLALSVATDFAAGAEWLIYAVGS